MLRNYLAQVAIEKAKEKDYGEIDQLPTILHHPFDDHPGMESYALPPPTSLGQAPRRELLVLATTGPTNRC